MTFYFRLNLLYFRKLIFRDWRKCVGSNYLKWNAERNVSFLSFQIDSFFNLAIHAISTVLPFDFNRVPLKEGLIPIENELTASYFPPIQGHKLKVSALYLASFAITIVREGLIQLYVVQAKTYFCLIRIIK